MLLWFILMLGRMSHMGAEGAGNSTANFIDCSAQTFVRNESEYVIGINTIRVLTKTVEEQFGPLARYLTNTVGVKYNKTFRAAAVNASELYTLPACGLLDFLYVNPVATACEALEFDGRVIATQIGYNFFVGAANETIYSGGEIIVRADSPYYTVADLRGKRIVAGSLLIIGGLPQLYYARRSGHDLFVNAKSIVITQDNRLTLYEMLQGNADAALTASFTRPMLYEAGIITHDEQYDMFRIINRTASEDNGVEVSGETALPEFSFMVFPRPGRVSFTAELDVTKALLNVAEDAPDAAVAAVMRGWGPAMDNRRTVEMLQTMGIYDSTTNSCIWHKGASLSESYPLIVCPPGFYKKSLDQLAGSCNGIVDCPTGQVVTDFVPGFTLQRSYGCICSPCVEEGEELTVRVGVRPADAAAVPTTQISGGQSTIPDTIEGDDGMNDSASFTYYTCSRETSIGSACAEAIARQEEIHILITDNLSVPRALGQLSLTPITNITITVIAGDDNGLIESPRPYLVPKTGNSTYTFHIHPLYPGIKIYQLFRNGVELPQSPIVVYITPAICPADKSPDFLGVCRCGDGLYSLAGRCRPLDAGRLVGLLVGLVLFVLLIFYIVNGMMQARSYSSVIIDPADIYIPTPKTILGVSHSGQPIYLGVYRSQEVALKAFVAPGRRQAKQRAPPPSAHPSSVNADSTYVSGRKSPVLSAPSTYLGGADKDPPVSDWDASYKGTSSMGVTGNGFHGAARPDNGRENGWDPEALKFKEDDLRDQGTLPPLERHGTECSASTNRSSHAPTSRSTHPQQRRFLSLTSFNRTTADSSDGSENIVTRFMLDLLFSKKRLTLSAPVVRSVMKVASIRHKNVVPIFGIVPSKEPQLVMDSLANGSLLDLIRNETVELDSDMTLKLAHDIASGIACLHGANVIHGALMTRSILVDEDLCAKVGGFRFRRIKPIETPYTAPEILTGQKPTAASDVYSLGIILYELFHRREAYGEQESPEEVVRGVLDVNVQKRPMPHAMSAPLLEVLKSCWHHDPSARASAKDLAQTLQSLAKANIPVAKENPSDVSKRRAMSSLNEESGWTKFTRNNYPPKIAQMLLRGEKPPPQRYEQVTVFFSDIVEYTTLCSTMTPEESVDLLERLYSGFDRLCQRWNLFKIETIGDAYIAVAGIPDAIPDHTRRAAMFALEARAWAQTVPIRATEPEGPTVTIRVGLHSGPVVGSVIGTSRPKFSLYGDVVNLTSRMETMAEPGMIQMTETSSKLLELQSLPNTFELVSRGTLMVKGKGQVIAYALTGLTFDYMRAQFALGIRFVSPKRMQEFVSSSPGAKDGRSAISTEQCHLIFIDDIPASLARMSLPVPDFFNVVTSD